MIKLPRLCLSGNIFIMPEDIVQVNFESKLVYTWPLLNTFTNGVSFKESRTDMVAP